MSTVTEIKPRRHPNRVPFRGILTKVDTPSNKAPSGARGHRVMLTRAAAEEALWSLKSMGVDMKEGWDGHNAQHKIGVIEDAGIEGNDLWVSGFLYAKDFERLVTDVHNPKRPLGMSYELADAHVDDMRCAVWKLNKVIFTGAAILYCDTAAYTSTSFSILASQEPFTGNMSFVEHAEVTGSLDAKQGERWVRL